MISMIGNICMLAFVVLGVTANVMAYADIFKKKEKKVIPVQKSKFQRSLTPEVIQRLSEIQGVYQ